MLKTLLFAFVTVGLALPLRAAEHGKAHGPGATAPAAAFQRASSNSTGSDNRASVSDGGGAASFDQTTALKISQAAIGRSLGSYQFRDRSERIVRLSDYRGKPLVISMIYTSCSHVCPITTRHLNKVVKTAQAAFGPDSFRVVTIGFDTAHDTPVAMADFARAQSVNLPNWEFLSADSATIKSLSKDLGFIHFASAKGYDHLSQTTLVDGRGEVYRQVYGETFETPLLAEPLKELISGVESQHPGIAGISNRIRLFCTVYDPATDSYRADYSLFAQIAAGLLVIPPVGWFLFREIRRDIRQRKKV